MKILTQVMCFRDSSVQKVRFQRSQKSNFMGLTAKVDYLKPNLLLEADFMEYAMGVVPKVRWMDSRAQ